MTMSTRRSFLARAGVSLAAAGAALGASQPALRRRPSGAGASGSALAPERRARFAQLVVAVAALEGGRAGRGYAERATRDFAGWYERNPNLRPMADHVLDGVAAAGGPRRVLTDPRADRVIATEAFALARPPFAPDRA
jgi:hypothetical protein